MPPKPVPCFHPYDKRTFSRLAPEKQREYLEEMARQLRRQDGRNPLAAGKQKAFGETFADVVAESIRDSLRRSGIGAGEAKRLAAQRTEQLTRKLAALHEPDMVAGGWLQPSTDRMGRADVNKAVDGNLTLLRQLAAPTMPYARIDIDKLMSP